jgi:hypothetical protein
MDTRWRRRLAAMIRPRKLAFFAVIISPSPLARQHHGNIPRCENSQSPEKTDGNTQKQAAVLHHLTSKEDFPNPQTQAIADWAPAGGVVLSDDWAEMKTA